MPEEVSPQQVGPGLGSGSGVPNPMPQATPATVYGPDSHQLPQMGEALSGSNNRDWEASFKGLQRRYDADRQVWEGERNQWQQMLQQFQAQLTQLSAPSPQAGTPAPKPQEPTPAPVSGGNQTTPKPTEPDALDLAIRTKKAQQYRDLLLDEYTSNPNSPYQGLPLDLFRDEIPVMPPTMDASGKLDDKAQRTAIENFANKLKGIRGTAQQQLLEGTTPGSAPGAGAPGGAPSADDVYQEFLDIMDVMGSGPAWDELDKAEQARVEARYFELLEDPAVEERHGGQTRPTMTVQDLTQKVRELSRQMSRMQGKNPLLG
jgi:hypothetical protein